MTQNSIDEHRNRDDYYVLNIPEPINKYGLEQIKREREFLILKFKNSNTSSSEKILSARLSIDIGGQGKFEKFVNSVYQKCEYFLLDNIPDALDKRTLRLCSSSWPTLRWNSFTSIPTNT